MDLSQFDETHLKRICKQLGLKYEKNSTRNNIIELIQSQVMPSSTTRKRKRQCLQDHNNNTRHIKNIIRIQRWWRRILLRNALISSHIIRPSNDSDFITLEPIEVEPFYLIEDSGHVYQFDPYTLANYFLKEGNFINPYTRRPLNSIEIGRLDRMVRNRDRHFVNLKEHQAKITKQRAEEREHVRVCQLMHTECLKIVSDLLALLQNPTLTTSKIMYTMIDHLLPTFFENFRQLFIYDYLFACDSIIWVVSAISQMSYDTSTSESHFVVECCLNLLSEFVKKMIPSMTIMLPELMDDVENRNSIVR